VKGREMRRLRIVCELSVSDAQAAALLLEGLAGWNRKQAIAHISDGEHGWQDRSVRVTDVELRDGRYRKRIRPNVNASMQFVRE